MMMVFCIRLTGSSTSIKAFRGRVVVVAPESERSGYSSALTLDRPLRPIPIAEDVWAVKWNTRRLCFLSMNGLFDFEFDLVVSGINSGANLGDDVLYSGTVGAAFEGRLMKQPAIAVSLAGSNVRSYEHPQHYAKAAQWVHGFYHRVYRYYRHVISLILISRC